MTLSANFALSLESLGPVEARDLTQELEGALEGNGTHAMLRTTSAAAAAVVLREAVVFHALCAFAEARGLDVRANAVKVAAAFAHPSPEDTRDALTRLITAALERGLRMVPSSRTERVDPLLHACADVVELVNAISTWRFGMAEERGGAVQTPPPASAEVDANSSPSSANADGRRRLTRDFEVSPPPVRNTEMPSSGERPVDRPSPARSTLRPSPARSTLRPTQLSQADVDKDAVLIPRTQVRDAQGRPLKKKW